MKRTMFDLNKDNYGVYGLCLQGMNKNESDSFDSIWTSHMLFHDVFEHAHDGKHKYFRDNASFNVGGEVAAMGAYLYFTDVLGVYKRCDNLNISTVKAAIATTMHLMTENIETGIFQYGDEMVCNVPYQRKRHDVIEETAELHYSMIKNIIPGHRLFENEYEDKKEFEDHLKSCEVYKKSITLSKLQRLYRWGAAHAERHIHDNSSNVDKMNWFIEYWEDFFKNHNATNMYYAGFEGLEVVVYGGADMKWSAHFHHSELGRVRHDSQTLDY